MLKTGKWLVAIVVIAAIAYGGFWVGKRTHATPNDSTVGLGSPATTSEPVATVHVARIRQDQITEELVFYGTVVVRQEKVSFISAPLESRLKRILVTPGQRVRKDDNLFELDLSPAAKLAMEQARINAAGARAALQLARQKFDEKLATNQEMTQATQAADLAEGAVKQLEQMYATAIGLHPSGFDGVVSQIDAQPGQIVVPGAPVVEVVSDDGIEVELGVELEDIRLLPLGNVLKVSAILAEKPKDVAGRIRLTTETIDPQTRLTKIYVSLPPQAGFMLGESVKAVAQIKTPPGLVVSRQAVIPDGEKNIVFLVQGDRAIEKVVRVGVDSGSEIEIFSNELKPGDQVATLGNSQLTDGMRVNVAGPADSGAAADLNASDRQPESSH
jgi:RND family efflux transporter MFP subunit